MGTFISCVKCEKRKNERKRGWELVGVGVTEKGRGELYRFRLVVIRST